MKLVHDDFAAFFSEVHGCEPFPWQTRLLRQVAELGTWPAVLDLPTGSGKTAAIDIAVFHLALEAERGAQRRAPARIAFVVDRRLVVDDAFTRAIRLEQALAAPPGPLTAQVAESLARLSVDGLPLVARRLRGGIPREDDWVRTPSQPTVLCSTVDQVGSRLLFRGYGVSDSMKPVHAGLLGSDCLILLDEAHLAEPLRQTLHWVDIYRGPAWREHAHAAPWCAALLTATPGEQAAGGFSLDDADRAHPLLKRRLNASKPARLVAPPKSKVEVDADAKIRSGDDLLERVGTLVVEAKRAIEHFEKTKHGALCPAIAVVANRVNRARAVFERLQHDLPAGAIDLLLLIGPARPVDRDALASQLATIRTGTPRALERPLVIVATQCIEAGVDIDLDGLITEAAPLDSLRQRFGRLNRAGRDVQPYASIVAARADIASRADDPVYGSAIAAAWRAMTDAAGGKAAGKVVEFGLRDFSVRMDADALSPRPDAPVLMPAHLDLLSQTSPIPAADPDVGLYLHGPDREPDSITVVWRPDIDPTIQRNEQTRRLLTLAPPRSLEAIQLPVWAVRSWLVRESQADDLADVAAAGTTVDDSRQATSRACFRWTGDDQRSCWISGTDMRPGDTVVVPASYGGVDEFGWNPMSGEPATDVGREAALPFAGRRFTVRVAPALLGRIGADALADALAQAASQRWQDLRAALLRLDLPNTVRDDLLALDRARGRRVVAHADVYGEDDDGRPRGVVFVAQFGIEGGAQSEHGIANATEDDTSGSLPGFRLTLAQHSADVESKAKQFALACCLAEQRVHDLKLAGFLHDAGKADSRFQAWLHYDDPLGLSLDDCNDVLAKSARPLPASARAASALPPNWRHEALSVRLALHAGALAEAEDPELVVWLIGSHHGYGRPFFPHEDPEDGRARTLPAVLGLAAELPAGPGPQSLAFDWRGLDWSALFVRLKARYGMWELARMEAIVRLADHRASEEVARRIQEPGQ